MKTQVLAIVTLLLTGCSGIGDQYQSWQTEQALAEAERTGNSGPLYDHYVDCVDNRWRQALESGIGEELAYEQGLRQCSHELTLLCNFYGVVTCFYDAKASNRVLFSLLLDDYRQRRPGQATLR